MLSVIQNAFIDLLPCDRELLLKFVVNGSPRDPAQFLPRGRSLTSESR